MDDYNTLLQIKIVSHKNNIVGIHKEHRTSGLLQDVYHSLTNNKLTNTSRLPKNENAKLAIRFKKTRMNVNLFLSYSPLRTQWNMTAQSRGYEEKIELVHRC